MSQTSYMAADPVEIGRAFTGAYTKGEWSSAAALLSPDVHERGLIPGVGLIELRGPDAVVAEGREFLAPYGRPEVLLDEVKPFGQLVRWSARWRLHDSVGSWLVEWHAFLTIEEGAVTALDMVCSGRLAEA